MTGRQWRKLLVGDFTLRRILYSAVFIYGCLLLLASFAADWLAFRAPPRTYEQLDHMVMIPTSDGESLAALFYPPPRSNGFTLLYSHGNAEDLGCIAPLCAAWHDLGFGVCAYDYRGYGLSSGRPREATARRDVLTVYDYLTNTWGIAPQSVIAHGRSLGCHMALHLAAHAPVAGLVLESGFLTGTRVLTCVPVFPFERFNNMTLLSQVDCPVLVIHGTMDMVIPVWHGHKLYDLAPEPKYACWVEGANHNDVIEQAGEKYFVRLRAFAKTLTRTGSTTSFSSRNL
jgi:fermentation-respiration switch protein FrsA (DUF1100 family)